MRALLRRIGWGGWAFWALLAFPVHAGEKNLTVIDVRPAWERFPQADFGTNLVKVDEIPTEAARKLAVKHTEEIRSNRISWLSDFARTNLEKDPSFRSHVEIGIVYAKNLFYKEALTWMRKALAMNKTSSLVYNNLANVLYLSGDTEQAVSNYQLALVHSRNDPRTLLNLSFIYYENGQPELARKNYLKAILIDPSLDRPEYQVIAGSERASSPR